MGDKTLEDDKNDAPEGSSSNVLKHLELVDNWSFDMFALSDEAKNKPLKCLTIHLFNRCGITEKFIKDPAILDNFINCIETGYNRFNNPYHNNVHAADVTQTMHSMLCKTGLISWLTDLEIFGSLLAAIIHDYEHTGTTNNFHVMTRSERALIYNDRSVQENHHLSASFFVLKEDNCNILSNLSREEYRQLRSLVIDLVLSTDMAFHFQLQKDIKNRMNSPDLKMDKSKVLALILHASDISNPTKNWSIASQWSALIMEEFFRQGDRERELNLPISPLCDRYDTLIPESQINFIDFIVKPTFMVCGEMLKYILEPITLKSVDETQNNNEENKTFCIQKPWVECIAENKKKWQEKTVNVWVCHQHLKIPKLDPSVPLPYTFVTILVDKISFTNFTTQANQDIRLSGHVSWVGKSSMEIVVWLEQLEGDQYKKITRALFLMAARNATNTKSAPGYPLSPANEHEQLILAGDEQRKERRKQLQLSSLLKVEPDAEEQKMSDDFTKSEKLADEPNTL